MRLIPYTTPCPRTPVTVITGFLGSGKTTVINRLLRRARRNDYAVLVNEFGAVPLDQHFLPARDGEIVVLPNGCLCCMAGDDIETAMFTLYSRRDGADVSPFGRLLIETSGLADPAPLIERLIGSPLLMRGYALESVVTTVDAVHARRQLEAHSECVRQVAIADRILLTKSDLAAPAEVADLRRRLRRFNPLAPIHAVTGGAIAPKKLFATRFARAGGGDERRGRDLAPLHGGHRPEGIDVLVLAVEHALDWAAFERWFRWLRIERGEGLLRAKGLLHVAGQEGAIGIHAVHHVMHPPVVVAARPQGGPRSCLVLITQGLDRGEIEAGWRALAAADAARIDAEATELTHGPSRRAAI